MPSFLASRSLASAPAALFQPAQLSAPDFPRAILSPSVPTPCRLHRRGGHGQARRPLLALVKTQDGSTRTVLAHVRTTRCEHAAALTRLSHPWLGRLSGGERVGARFVPACMDAPREGGRRYAGRLNGLVGDDGYAVGGQLSLADVAPPLFGLVRAWATASVLQQVAVIGRLRCYS